MEDSPPKRTMVWLSIKPIVHILLCHFPLNAGPYLGTDGKCHDKEVKKSVKLSGWYNVTQFDANAMKLALYNHGPVTGELRVCREDYNSQCLFSSGH